MIIYRAVNKTNGKSYVGQTVNGLKQRRGCHISDALNNKDNNYFHNSIQKHGPDNFTWTILHDNIIDINFLNQLEIFYIGYYDTFENGYNLTLGGGGKSGYIVSEETRRRMSESRKDRIFSDETKRKISESNRGKKRSEETKRKLSKAAFNRLPVSEETKRKMSKSGKGRKTSPETKRKLSKASGGKNNHNYGKHHSEKIKQLISKASTIDLTNQIFGKLLVKRRAGVNRCGEIEWECLCDCGNEKIISGHSLRRGSTKSCGCEKFKGKSVIIGNKQFQSITEASIFLHISASTVSYRLKNKITNYRYAESGEVMPLSK